MRTFDLYHENSKLSPWDWEYVGRIRHINSSDAATRFGDAPIVDRTAHKSLKLPLPSTTLRATLADVLRQRRSSMAFSADPLDLQDLATLLHFATGLNGSLAANPESPKPLRFYPSPGGLYPTSIWAEARRVKALDSGLYSYLPHDHEVLTMDVDVQLLADATKESTDPSNWACVIWLLVSFDRLFFKYGERSYRFALLEAGHIAQNIVLVSTALGLASRPIGGFFDEKVAMAMRLQSYDLVPVYGVGISVAIPAIAK